MRRAARFCAALALAALAGAALWSGGAAAHPLAPSLLAVSAQADGSAEILFRTPAVLRPGARLAPLLPKSCTPPSGPPPRFEAAAAVMRWRVQCAPGVWPGAALGIAGLRQSGGNGLVRLEVGGKLLLQAVVHAARPTVAPPPARPQRPYSWRKTALDYAALGLRHILGGPDHLLFAAGLLLLLRGPRRLALALSAFTLGHSITLALAALGIVAPPAALIEPAIAISLIWLGFEAARAAGIPAAPAARRTPPRRAGLWAAGFGLLHGFGFAAALSQTGLPPGDIPLALASFNLGIEFGQLAFVAVTGGAAWWLARHWPLPHWTPRAAAYAIGSLGVFWLLERSF